MIAGKITLGSSGSTSRPPNGEIIASSQGYKSKEAAEKGIQSVQTNAPGASVVDKTG